MWEKQALPNQHVRSYPTQSKKLSASQGFKHCLKCGGENGGLPDFILCMQCEQVAGVRLNYRFSTS